MFLNVTNALVPQCSALCPRLKPCQQLCCPVEPHRGPCWHLRQLSIAPDSSQAILPLEKCSKAHWVSLGLPLPPCHRLHAGARQSCRCWRCSTAPADDTEPNSLPAASPVSWCTGMDQGINLRDVSGKGIIISPFAAVLVEKPPGKSAPSMQIKAMKISETCHTTVGDSTLHY